VGLGLSANGWTWPMPKTDQRTGMLPRVDEDPGLHGGLVAGTQVCALWTCSPWIGDRVAVSGALPARGALATRVHYLPRKPIGLPS
jgi:hypothetical protein